MRNVDVISQYQMTLREQPAVNVSVMPSINQVLIQSVVLETRGWRIKFGQKCPHCNTPNTIEIYKDNIVCGRCERIYVMDNPKLQASGGRQIGSAK